VCGIAGYSVGPDSVVGRTLAAQALLAGIAERGADAVGYGYRVEATASLTVHKQQTGATALLDAISVPPDANQVIVHVRDYTKGHPTIAANNHPVRHGPVVGIHNGIIENDDELFASHGWPRHEPDMTVDSEVIFALMEETQNDHGALEQLHGAMAAAWIDERDAATLFVVRGVQRPLWLARGPHETFFASTRAALEVVGRTVRLALRFTEVREGRMLLLQGGSVVAQRRFRPDASYREARTLPAVRAPHEGVSCLARLAVLATTP
jgi:glucosamine 6-phosphate synthetase-like amidotransferase/phosphosugar isomerase protein